MNIVIKGIGSYLPDIDHGDNASSAGRSAAAMAYQAVKRCLDDANYQINDISGIVTASVDLWDGKTASNIQLTEAVGAVMRAETRIAGDGLQALMHGAMMVMSGHYQRVLVVAQGKSSEGDIDAISNWSFDPVFQQTLGLTNSVAVNLQTQAVMEHNAQLKQVVADVASALHGGDDNAQAPAGDGACAVLLEAGEQGVVLAGFSTDLEQHYLGDRDLSNSQSLSRAAARAYAMAGEIDAGQIDRCYFSISSAAQLPLWAQAVGCWNVSQPSSELLSKKNQLVWRGAPPFVAGLQRLVAAVGDLRQQQSLDRVLVQGCHGPAGQVQAVCVLELMESK